MRFKIGDYLRKKPHTIFLALKMTSSEWGYQERGDQRKL